MRLNVLFVPTTNSGISFYRMTNYWPAIYRQGLANCHCLWWQNKLTEMHPWERDITEPHLKWRLTKEIQDYILWADVVVFQMLHTEAGLAIFRAIRDMRPELPVLSEIDDNMVSTPTYNAADPFYAPGQLLRTIAIAQFKESDGMIVSTPYLAEVYSEYNENIHVIENAIDFQIWDRVQRKYKGGLRIGWAGGATHEEDLRILETVIPRINAKFRDVKWIFLHGLPHYLRKLPGVIHVKSWARIDKYPQALGAQNFDIGMAPLVDNAFNRGKSNLRWLEYSALGIPTVASRVGHFKETIQDGVDGILADDADSFASALELLASDKRRRKDIGASANARIRRDFNTEAIAAKYVAVLTKIKTGFKPKPIDVAAPLPIDMAVKPLDILPNDEMPVPAGMQ